ncbi:MAG: reverse transcriptase domain-containing protein, partial [Thermoanaerobaculia bacterium]
RAARLPLDPYVLELLSLWVRAEVYDGRRVYRMRQGIPQGAVISPMLANLFLDELDENLALFGQKVVRYADDFLVLCKNPSAAVEALELTDYLLEELELELNRDKTAITSFDQGFKFLGALFVKDTVYLPLDPRKPQESPPPWLPPPLDLLGYLELREPEDEGQ